MVDLQTWRVTCGGQNRNKIIITAMVSFLSQANSIKFIEQKFFESGHSHTECDTMHSATESTYAKKEVNLPADILILLKLVQKIQLYEVTEITHEDIFDFAALNSAAMSASAFNDMMKSHYLRFDARGADDPEVSISDEIHGQARKVSGNYTNKSEIRIEY